MSQVPFKVSTVGKLEQLSTVEVRRNVLQQRDIRPGHTTALPGLAGDVTGWSDRTQDIHGKPKTLAPHLARIQNTLAADGQPAKSSAKLGISATGAPAVELEARGSIPLPDIRDEKGHNPKNRITRVRGSI